MPEKKGANKRLYPAIALGDICTTFLNIPKVYVRKEICRRFPTIVGDDAVAILKGKKDIPFEEDGRPAYLKYWDIVMGTVDIYIEAIEKKFIPDGYSQTQAGKRRYKKIQNDKIAKIRERLNANEDAIQDYLNFACGTSEHFQAQSEAWKDLRVENSMVFCKIILSNQSPENIYVFGRNINAFLLIAEDQGVLEFCETLYALKKASRKIIETVRIESSFGELLNWENNKCLSQWLAIRANYYTDSGKQQFSDYDRKEFKKEEDKALEMAVRKLHDKIKQTAPADAHIPVWLASLIQLLWNAKNIDALITFLLCDSTNRKRLLNTAKELKNKEESAALQTVKQPE